MQPSIMFPKPEPRVKTKKRIGRVSKNPRKTAHRRAWSALSLYVRLSNADTNGNVKCFTCDAVVPYKEAQAGHFIHGDNMDFVKYNINPQCVRCNKYLSGNLIEYSLRMIRLYGQEVVEDLMRKKYEIVKYRIQDFRDLEAVYMEKLHELV
jgi:hypothetical protein